MRILVSGHRGYIGAVLAPMLARAGHEVIGLDVDLFRRCTFGSRWKCEIPTILKDIRDVEREDVEGFDAIIHLAGLSNDPLGDLDEELTNHINLRSTIRLAELAKDFGVKRFVFSSSCSNYGVSGSEMVQEDAPLNPVTPYAKSKVISEREISKMANDCFSPTFLRNATAYGLSPKLRFDLVLNNLVGSALTTGKVMLKSDGTAWRPVVHVEDIARAFLAVLETPQELIHNIPLNIGSSDENYRIRDLAMIVHELVPDCEVAFADGVSADKRSYRVDCDKALRTLQGFQPEWTVRRGVQQLFDAFKKVGVSREEFEGPKFERVAHVRQLMAEGVLDQTLRSPCDDFKSNAK